jgi:hypothetical protein
MDACLSDFAIDDHELHGGAPPGAVAPLEGCRSCQARVAERRARVAEFQDRWSAGTWERVTASRARATRRRGWALLSGVTVLGAAAASWVLLIGAPSRVRRAGTDVVVPKGASVAEVVCRRRGETFPLGDGDEVRPGDELRFRVLGADARGAYVQVGSVDGSGAYASFYPPGEGDVSVERPAAGQPLPESIRLDDAPGPERVLVVLSETPLPVSEVRAAALAHAARAERIDRIGAAPVTSAWLVFPKRPAGPSAP